MAASEAQAASQFWHTNLDKLPTMTASEVEEFLKKNTLAKQTTSRGYQFFIEGYLHKIEVSYMTSITGEADVRMRARCFRSMKKNEDPHSISLAFGQSEPKITSWSCSCAVGKGLCHHVIGLIYTVAHFQMLGLKSVPPVQSKISLPQVGECDSSIIFSLALSVSCG